MKATLTSKGQITIPPAIRRRLGLQAGQILEFDEAAPYILAVPVFDEGAMREVVGYTLGRLRKPQPSGSTRLAAVSVRGLVKLALDGSVLLTVFNQEPGAEDWIEVLIQARRQGLLVLFDVVYTEVTPAFESHPLIGHVL